MRSNPLSSPIALLASEIPHAFTTKAILFSKFPNRFVNQSIIPKLERRGIVVERVVHPKRALSLGDTEASMALFMFEMSSHSENNAVKEFCSLSNIPLVPISRKSSAWGDKLPPELSPALVEAGDFDETAPSGADEEAENETNIEDGDETMPDNTIRSVPNDKVEAMLLHMMDLHGKGVGYADMIGPLKKYWTNGVLSSPKQLRSYLGNILRRDDCPQFYKQWIEDGRPAYRANEPDSGKLKMKTKKTKTKTEMNGMRNMTDAELSELLGAIVDERRKEKPYREILPMAQSIWPGGNGPKDVDQLTKFVSSAFYSPRCPAWFKEWYGSTRSRPGVANPKKAPPQEEKKVTDDAELAKMFSDENEKLKKENEKLKEKISSMENTKSKGMSTSEKIRGDLLQIFSHCQSLIAIGVMDADETIRIAMTYLERSDG